MRIKSQSKKIFAAAPTHIPTNANAGEPSLRTNTERQVESSMGTEKAE